MLEAVVETVSAPPEPGTGWGVACGIESSGIGRPAGARIALDPDGQVTVKLGSTPHGQGHLTAFAQLAAERLGWPLERVTVLAGDTRHGPPGAQTAASRSAIEFGNATALAAAELRERIEGQGLPAEGLELAVEYTPRRPRSWGPNCHAARVRVDAETGRVELLDYAVAHDAGPLINPAIVEGQVWGGLAHAIGYALFEELAYEEDGRLAGSTFLDYLLPGPPEVPLTPRILHFETPSTQNEEGFRGVGESGTIPAPAAILSAIESALRSLGRDVALSVLPATPERIIRPQEV